MCPCCHVAPPIHHLLQAAHRMPDRSRMQQAGPRNRPLLFRRGSSTSRPSSPPSSRPSWVWNYGKQGQKVWVLTMRSCAVEQTVKTKRQKKVLTRFSTRTTPLSTMSVSLSSVLLYTCVHHTQDPGGWGG